QTFNKGKRHGYTDETSHTFNRQEGD
ncbi:MAG: hypothetical protein RL636_1531, partial [Verrucomicrobiota bacterium]